ncbi:MAG: DUF4178 domain-containing protein [Acidobacteriia bacterium]|nr:DUF4178 domain-containing protein [Terriglobia bacterium]
MSSPLVAPPVVKSKSLHCPNCGGPVQLRGFGHALTVVCQQCLTVLDATTPELKILQHVQEKYRVKPLIALGQRGKIGGTTWEVIGFQARTVYDEGTAYTWYEYLLFNPYKGFRYLTEYDGHWNFVTALEPQPVRKAAGGRGAVVMDGHTFRHFSGAEAQTTFVLGEFPWRVKMGDKVVADDFIDPPLVLSSETTDDEITWSRGEYTPGSEIWKTFSLQGSPPPPKGIYLNQPSPYGKGSMWRTFWLLVLALLLVVMFFAAMNHGVVVFQKTYSFSTADKGEPSLVTPIFEIKGHGAMELNIGTSLANDWAYFNFALINDDTGEALDFGREVSYYYGSDSDGSWSEGGRSSSIYIPALPAGHYYLRIEPEMEAKDGNRLRGDWVNNMNYTITLRHGVTNATWYWIAGLLLLIPPIFSAMRRKSFETRRWMQSDYPPVRSGGGD